MLRMLFVNRVGAALLAVAAIIAAINLYVSFNDDGVLIGTVVDPNGRPVPDAQVTIYRPALIGLEEIATQTTDAAGRFRFEDHDHHHPAVQARVPGLGQSDLRRVRLYFRNQNRRLDDPIRLEAGQ
jgi:hypothetical protein